VVALAPADEGITAVVLVDELAGESGLVVEIEDEELEIAFPYWSTVASVMLKNVLSASGTVALTWKSMRLN
jgi:hypothetical protein